MQEVCNRVAVISQGRIVHEGALADLAASTAPRYRLRATDTERAAEALARVESVRELRREHGELSFTLANDADAVALTRALADASVGISELVREQTTLEELFFRLTEAGGESSEPAEVAAA